MKELNVPGIVWVVLLLGLGIAIQAGTPWIEANLGISSILVTTFVGLLFMGAKALNPGTKDLNQAIDIIEQLTGRLRSTAVSPEMRSAGVPEIVALEPMPERPNKVASILWG
jgi:hypothetical protein